MTGTGNDKKLPYAVGYKKPPAKTQFKKGHSGNARGKLPGRKNLKTEIVEELSTRITVTENGKQFKLSKQSIIIKRMVSDAAKGDARARDQLIRLLGEIEQAQPPTENDPIGAAKDTELLERFKEELIANIKKATK
jgi:hypothetical protein